MLKRFSLTALAVVLATGMGYAQSNPNAPTTLNKTNPTSGK